MQPKTEYGLNYWGLSGVTLRTMRHEMVKALKDTSDESIRYPGDEQLAIRFMSLVDEILAISNELASREA